jgi:hypothetical protein
MSLALTVAMADSSIRLSTYPTYAALSDGRTPVHVTAEVRDQNGRGIADGTRVVFDSTLGVFQEAITTTSGGTAHATLIAPSSPGIATITATALTGGASPATMTFEFVGDKSLLSSAKEYIEIVSPGYLQYAYDNRGGDDSYQILAAAGIDGGVSLRYHDLSLTADDIQLDMRSLELRGKKVKLKLGKVVKMFDEFNFRLDTREGYGTTNYMAKRANQIVTQGVGLVFVKQNVKGGPLSIPPDEEHYGLVHIERLGLTPQTTNLSSLFVFRNLIHVPSFISARKAIIYPKRKIQFQAAKIYVGGQKVLTAPLYEYNLVTATPLVTEQMLGVTNSQLQANYPYFLSLQPGESSLLRLRTGNQYGRTDTPDSGVFLDYELNWDHGDDMQGSFIFSGIGRNDWTVGLNEFYRLDDRTSTSAQLFTPTGESYYGNASANHQFNGFSTGLSGDVSRTVTGIQYTASDYSATVAKDPIKVGTLPYRIYLELTETSSYNQLINESQTGGGARARIQSLALPIDRNTTWTNSLTTSYLVGQNELHAPQYLATVTLNHRFDRGLSSTLTYNFTRDGFNEYVIGEHQLTLQNSYNSGNTGLNLMLSKSLDIDRSTIFGDLGYRLSKLWRVTTGYTYDTYRGTTFLDYNYGFTYRLGWREVGLIWSEQTRRVGLQILGTTGF